ncbi:MAG: glycosyltransferase family 4 protein [Candidatus Helarchaeota archaeon]
MKIFLHDYGGYNFTAQLSQTLAERGHTVHYAYSETTQQVKRFGEKPNENLHVEGITLYRPFEKYNYIQRWRGERAHGRKVADKILDIRPDVVISANTPLDAQRLIQKASRQVGARFIFWLQDVISLATIRALREKYPLIGKVIGLYYQRLEKTLVRRSLGVIIISDDFLPLMEDWGISAEKIHVIHNWAPVDRIAPRPHNNLWAKKTGLADTFNFLYTGILGLKHDPSIFLDLAEHFRDEKNVRVVVSKGDRFEWLRSESGRRGLNNLVLLEFQSSEVYPLVLAAGDVLVSVLRPEAGQYSVPSKVLSYLCAQRPILLSVPQENLASKIVTEAKAGLVASPGDLEDFLEKARHLYENEDLRYNFGKSGRAYVEANFNIEDISRLFEDIIT